MRLRAASYDRQAKRQASRAALADNSCEHRRHRSIPHETHLAYAVLNNNHKLEGDGFRAALAALVDS
jgi:hypothetical protein